MVDPRVLELRVHGIANAPPQDMLSTTPDDVVKVKGDELGSFWMRESADPDRDPNVRVEAYSWGNQTRSGGDALAVIGRVFVHLSWLFVLPFGLCNLAYWARRNIPGDKPPEGSETRQADAGRDRPRWHAGTGAMAIRWFALLQTLFYTTGFMSVMVDLIAVQCYRPRVSPTEGSAQIELVCAALPEWFDIFEDWSRVSRSALFAVVPVLAMLVIFLVGLRVRGTFEPNRDHDENLEDDELAAQRRRAARDATKRADRRTPTASSASSASTGPAQGVDPPAGAVVGVVDPGVRSSEATSPPLLANRGFWRRSRVAQTSERAHFAGVLSFVLLLLTMDTLFEIVPLDFDDLQGWWDRAVAEAPFALPGAGIGALLLVGTIWVTSLAVNDAGGFSVRATRRLATLVLAASAVCYVLWTLGSIFLIPRDGTGSGDDQFVGLSVAPVIISTICALIALSSLTWVYRRRMAASVILLTLSLLFGGFTALYRLSDDPDEVALWASFIGTFIFAVVALLLGYFHRGAEKEHRKLVGWHGNGAAVCMLIALFASMTITSLLVIGAHAWLSTSTEDPTTEDRIWRLLPVDPENALDPPDFYVQFAVLLLAILAILLVMSAVVALTAFTRMPRLTVPRLRYPDGTERSRIRADRNRGGTNGPEGFYPVSEKNLRDKERAVASARRLAGIAHRGERMLAALAILTAVALAILTAAALLPPTTAFVLPPPPEVDKGTLADWLAAQQVWRGIASAAGWALGLFAIAAVAWVVSNAVTSAERPLGLFWDVICFFPRAAHPFTPPCYAERTVPELEERLEEWFRGDRSKRQKGAILAAHSMGAPIVVAVVFSIAAERRARPGDHDVVPIGRIALLTYGVQLRAYFGRFFPAVFGPEAIGTPGTYAPSLVRRDPWANEVKREWDIPPWWRRGATLSKRSKTARDVDLPVSTGMTLVELLGGNLAEGQPPRWRSLWRRTDYLGFPANSFRSDDNPIDRGASERAPRPYLWTVARHNDYVGTLQYVEARDELLEALKRPRVGRRIYEALAPRFVDARNQPPAGAGGSQSR